MTTNQTIDGVPRLRELLDRLDSLDVDELQGWAFEVGDELRALLDKTDADFPASRPQGEPVIHIAPEVFAMLRGERKMRAGGLTYSQSKPLGNWTVPLYAEPPAPVAVTLQQVLKAYEYAESHPHKYLRGTTNWCAAVAHSLNTK